MDICRFLGREIVKFGRSFWPIHLVEKSDKNVHSFGHGLTRSDEILKLHPLPARAENSQAYHIPISARDYRLHSFYQQTVRDWNVLPEAVVMATATKTFKDSISQ